MYHHVRRKAFLTRNQQELLQILEPENTIQVPHFESLYHPMDGVITDEWKAALRDELSTALFSNEGLCRARLKLNIAMVYSVGPFMQVQPLLTLLGNISYG